MLINDCNKIQIVSMSLDIQANNWHKNMIIMKMRIK